ncbi:DNA-directed DNA polymerase alpha catalytic subunit pol1 [Conglomerata obtusa]
MYFYLLHVEQETDTSIKLYGFETLNIKSTPVKYLKPSSLTVKKVISPFLFHNTEGLFEKLDDFLRPKKIEYSLEFLTMQNFFNKRLPSEVNLIRANTKSKITYNKFSETNIFCMKEFVSPVEQFIVGNRIKGPGILEIENYEVFGDNEIVINEHKDIKFIRNDDLPPICIAVLNLEMKFDEIVSYCIKISGADEKFFIGTQNYNYQKGKNINDIEHFVAHKNLNEMIQHINCILKSNDVNLLIYHNIHKNILSHFNFKGIMTCDTFNMSQSLTKGKDFTITELKENLNIVFTKKHNIKEFNNFVEETESILSIFNCLDILELSKQMTEICGNLLSRTFSNQRAERIEYFLLHEMYERKYLFPDKNTSKKEYNYTGGLVLEPITGFYETLILLLDFNSLYPSLIQEFNICFSTVGTHDGEKEDDQKKIGENEALFKKFDMLYQNKHQGFLPKILGNLVQRRKNVKELITKANNQKEKGVLETRQKALKLTANSIYGCLGSPFSRFSNYTMASYITFKGRELLKETKNIAENVLKMKVIYGDTDSIMIDTTLIGINSNYSAALKQSFDLKNRINGKYKFIEIEVEKIIKKLLLYTKKKYGCLYINDKQKSFIENKGLDFTRRDYANVANDLSQEIFQMLLIDLEKEYHKYYDNKNYPGYFTDDTFIRNNGNPIIQNMILHEMSNYKNNIKNLPIDKFVINVQLKRDPQQYTMAVNMPHVSLALRLKEKGIHYKKDDIISFVIGQGKVSDNISTKTYLVNENYVLDYSYYIENQILPTLHRLLAIFNGISADDTNKIFGIIKIFKEVQKQKITLITPCCKKVCEPKENCDDCNKIIPEIFYMHKIYELMRREIRNLYVTEKRCNECGYTTENFYKYCINCQLEMFEIIKNADFDEFLTNLHSSFENFPKCLRIIESFMDASAYRTINLRNYFKQEIQNFTKNNNQNFGKDYINNATR